MDGRTVQSNPLHVDALLKLRCSAEHDGRVADLQLIDAALDGNADAMLRARINGVGLTPRQWDILRFIDDYGRERGIAPTLQEIADGMSITKTTAYEHVQSLCGKHVLQKNRESRSIRIVMPSNDDKEK